MSRSRRPARRRRQAMIDAELVSWLEGLAQGLETGFNGAVNEVLRVGMGKINRDRLAAELGDSELDRFDWMLDAELVRMLLGLADEAPPIDPAGGSAADTSLAGHTGLTGLGNAGRGDDA